MKAFILRHKPDIIFAFVLVASILLFNTVAVNAYIPSKSMENTLMTHDRIIGYKLYKDYKRGDIAIFKYDPDTYYIKRVIGVGGDRIEIKNHKVYVNGEELDEPYIREEMKTGQDLYYEVPEDCYFFLGDNRNHSPKKLKK